MAKRIVSDPAILSGTPVFRGTRIPVEHVVGLIRAGVSSAEIVEDYPALSQQDIAYASLRARQVATPAPSSGSDIKPVQIRRKPRAA
jgi:uncharacterized protein (DUF433 family)